MLTLSIILATLPRLLADNIHLPIRPTKGSAHIEWRKRVALPKKTSATNDPIRFTLQSNKHQVHVGEEIELTITAELLNISSKVMFFLDGTNAFSLKLLTPDGFVRTDGGTDILMEDVLSFPSNTLATYHIRGKFHTTNSGTCFRLLRSERNPTAESRYVEKATLCYKTTNNPEVASTRTSKNLASSYILFDKAEGDNTRLGAINSTGTGNKNSVPDPNAPYCSESFVTIIAPTNGSALTLTSPYTFDIKVKACSPNGVGLVQYNISDSGGFHYIDYQDSPGTDPQLYTLSASTWVSDGQYFIPGPGVYTINAKMFISGGGTLEDNIQVTVVGGNTTTPPSGGNLSGCFTIQNGASNLLAYATTGNMVKFLPAGNGEALNNGSIWKLDAVGTNQYKITSQAGNGDQVIYASPLNNGQKMQVGSYNNDPSHNWTLEASTGGSYRVQTNQKTWDQDSFGQNPSLQIYGDDNNSDPDYNHPYRLFTFATAMCPTGPTLPTGGNLTKVNFYFRGDNCQVCQDRCRPGLIQGSNDMSNWTTLYDINNTILQSGLNVFPISTSTTWRYLRYQAASGCYGEVTELEFYNGSNKLQGTPFGSTDNINGLGYLNAFDSDYSTLWHGNSPGNQNYAGIDLGGSSNPNPVVTTNRVGTKHEVLNVNVAIQNGVATLTDAGSPNYNSNYSTYYFINEIYVGSALNTQVPVNGKYLIDKLVTNFPIFTSPSGYQYIEYQYYGDGRNIVSRSQQVISTYDATSSSTFTEQAINGGTLLPLNQQWFVQNNTWSYEAVNSAPSPAVSPASIGKIWGGVVPSAGPSANNVFRHSQFRTKGWNAFAYPDVNPDRDTLASETQNLLDAQDVIQAFMRTGRNFDPSKYQDGVDAANLLGQNNIKFHFDEVSEGMSKFPQRSAAYVGIIERIRQINSNALIFGSYGQLGVRYFPLGSSFQPSSGGLRAPRNDSTYVRLYQSQQAARTKEHGIVDDFYSSITDTGKSFWSIGLQQVINMYPLRYNEIDLAFLKMHEMDVMLKQDPTRRPVSFFWSQKEQATDSLQQQSGEVEWEHVTTNPAGRVIRTDHPICGLIAPEVVAFDSFVRGQGMFLWNNSYYRVDDPNAIEDHNNSYPPNVFYLADGSTSTFPYKTFYDYSHPDKKPNVPLAGYDAAHQGRDKALRALQFLGTPTPDWQYVTYTLNGVQRAAPADGSAILTHAQDFKPMAMLLRNPSNGKRVVWAVDPYCTPNTSQSISVDLGGGASITIPMKGNAVHVVLVN